MERRVLIAVVLSFLVLYAYQALFVPPPPPSQRVQQVNPAEPPPPPAVSPNSAPASTPSVPDVPQPEALTSEPTERQIVVETSSVQAVFSNRGGRVVQWRLKEYRDGNGQPLDLVPSNLPEQEARPFSLRVDDEQLTRRLNSALYRVSGDTNGRVDATSNPATLVFEYQDAAGLSARKEFRIDPRSYVVGFSASVTSGDMTLNPLVQWGPGLGDAGASTSGGSFFTGNYIQPPSAIFHREGDVERLLPDALREQPTHEGAFRFVGIDDHYFIALALNPGQARVQYRLVTLPGEGEAQRQLLDQSFRFAETATNRQFYFGPKQFEQLRAVDAQLVYAINFGIFQFLAVPLLGALTWIHGYVGNWGWAIILLTIVINIVVFPLRHKSVVSMRKMQMLQPQMKAIQDRYAGMKATDPARQKMNTEIMNLYREKGVNPASGCVPMLLQMPLLFAFYSMLSQAIELRGAEFGLWIHDLSRADPYFVVPILMAISMYWQQKITPTTADPAQQRIMMMMPLMFSVMFLWAPSGLVIYWFVSNLWAIGQQYFTNWWLGPPPITVVRPPAERRLKSAGAGKSAGAKKD
ncbi:MAG TPA: membrane protein insertase YidC [Vicinamibacterales bacterium]